MSTFFVPSAATGSMQPFSDSNCEVVFPVLLPHEACGMELRVKPEDFAELQEKQKQALLYETPATAEVTCTLNGPQGFSEVTVMAVMDHEGLNLSFYHQERFVDVHLAG